MQNAKFDTFWKYYPKHKGKAEAVKAFSKINPDNELLEQMLTSLEEQKKSNDWKKNNGQFIPLPSTWLNQMRWEDEVELNTYSEFDENPF